MSTQKNFSDDNENRLAWDESPQPSDENRLSMGISVPESHGVSTMHPMSDRAWRELCRRAAEEHAKEVAETEKGEASLYEVQIGYGATFYFSTEKPLVSAQRAEIDKICHDFERGEKPEKVFEQLLNNIEEELRIHVEPIDLQDTFKIYRF